MSTQGRVSNRRVVYRRSVRWSHVLCFVAVAMLAFVGAAGTVAAQDSGGADLDDSDELSSSVVIGQDDRVQVTNTDAWPRRASGYLAMQFPDGNSFRCSAFTIEPDVIMTAAHCIYSNSNGGWANQTLRYYPGQLNRSTQPFYRADWTHIVTYKKWTDSEDSNYDMAVVQLDRPIGKVVGWKGRVAAPSDHGLYTGWLNINQYPGDKPRQTMWFDSNTSNSVWSNNDRFISHSVDTAGGSSGSSVYVYYSGNSGCPSWATCPGRYTAGVHTYGGNYANRLTPDKYGHVEQWLNDIVNKNLVSDKPDLVDDGPRWSGSNKDTVSAGNSVEITHDVRNIGTSTASNSYDIEYYLVDDFSVDTEDPNIDSTDTKIGQVTESSNIGPFRYSRVSSTLQVPDSTTSDDYYVCFELDTNDDVDEFDDSNNAACLEDRINVGTTSTSEVSPTVADVAFSGGSTTPGGEITADISFTNDGSLSDASVQLSFNEPSGWSISDFGEVTKSDGSSFTGGEWFESDRYLELNGIPAGETVETSFTFSVPGDAAPGDYDYTPSFVTVNGQDITPPTVTFTVEGDGVAKSELPYLEQIADSPWANKTVPAAGQPAGPPPLNEVPGDAQEGIAIDSASGQEQVFSLRSNSIRDASDGDRGLVETYDDVGGSSINDEPSTSGFGSLTGTDVSIEAPSSVSLDSPFTVDVPVQDDGGVTVVEFETPGFDVDVSADQSQASFVTVGDERVEFVSVGSQSKTFTLEAIPINAREGDAGGIVAYVGSSDRANATAESLASFEIGGGNPFTSPGGGAKDRNDVIGGILEWNQNGTIDGVSYSRDNVIDFIVEWNLA